MANFGELFQTGDWKKEKHSPVIEAPESAKADENIEIKASIGKEVPHPNTTEHHIRWITLVFKPDNDKFSYELGRYEFNAHGESVKGADEGPAYTEPFLSTTVKLRESGTIYATSYCNKHGLWENQKKIEIK
ncbi:MAG: class II SORL domain-containing protein [Spirochaetota bacterium]